MKRLQVYTIIRASTMGFPVKVGTLIFATAAMYHQDLIILANEALQSEIVSHILLIPFLVTYLIYRKRKMLMAAISSEAHPSAKTPAYMKDVTGALLCLFAFFLYRYGSLTFMPLEYHMLSLPIFIAGSILLLFNPQILRILAFPIGFLLFLTPPPLETIYNLGSQLSETSSKAAYSLLRGIGLPVTLAEQYGTPVITLAKPDSSPLVFQIDIACSGVYSLIGFLIFATFITYTARSSSWKKAVLFFSGFSLIFVMNILRIIIIVLIGNSYGMESALQAFHLLGGWMLIFLGTLLLLIASEKIFKIRLFARRPTTSPCPKCVEHSQKKLTFCHSCGKLLNSTFGKLQKFDLLKSLAIIALMSLVLTVQVPVFALTEGPAEVRVSTLTRNPTKTQILPQIANYTLTFVGRDLRFEQRAEQDAALTYLYIPFNNNSKEIIWITVEMARSKSSLHPIDVCLTEWPEAHGRPPRVTQLDLRDVQLIQNPPLPARFFAFQHEETNSTYVALYWFENAVFKYNSTTQKEFVKISVIKLLDSPTEILDAEEQLLQFGKSIADYWNPMKMWSQISMDISQNATSFLATTGLLLAVVVIIQTMKNNMEKKRNLTFYNKLSPEDKLLVQTILKADKHDHPTTTEVMSSYNELSGEKNELSTIATRLSYMKNIGLTRLKIASREDTPIMVWRARIPMPTKSQLGALFT